MTTPATTPIMMHTTTAADTPTMMSTKCPPGGAGVVSRPKPIYYYINEHCLCC